MAGWVNGIPAAEACAEQQLGIRARRRTIAVEPTLQKLGVLGLLVLIRTLLSFALEIEIGGRLPWRRDQDNAPHHPGERPDKLWRYAGANGGLGRYIHRAADPPFGGRLCPLSLPLLKPAPPGDLPPRGVSRMHCRSSSGRQQNRSTTSMVPISGMRVGYDSGPLRPGHVRGAQAHRGAHDLGRSYG